MRALSDEEYLSVMAVCAMFPHVDMTVDVRGELPVTKKVDKAVCFDLGWVSVISSCG